MSTLLQFVGPDCNLFSCIYVSTRLPCHNDVVLGTRRQVEALRLAGTPRKIRWPVGVTTVHKDELGGSILRIIRCLLLSNLCHVPDVYSSIGRGRSKYGRIMRRPGELKNFILMSFERVHLLIQSSRVPHCDGLQVEISVKRQRDHAVIY